MHGETLNLSDECVFTEWAVAGPEIARVITEFEVAMLTRKNAVFKHHDEDSHEVVIIDTQWRIVGSRGPGARNSVGPSAMVRPNVCQLEALEAPRWGPRQSPGGKHILATI